MGQYFVIVNLDKKEFIHPHKLASGLKFWEILTSNSATRALAFLLRQSTDDSYVEDFKFCGHWAGDKITIVGDYDDSKIYEKCTDLEGLKSHNDWVTEEKRPEELMTKADLFKDITDKMLKEYNKFIEIPDYQVDMKSEGWRTNKEENKKPKASPDMILSSTGIQRNPRL